MRYATTVLVGGAVALAAALTPYAHASDHPPTPDPDTSRQAAQQATPKPDLSGRKRVGKASFYAKMFAGRQMANGVPMDPYGNNAASRTLPLGTTTRVTNIETGKSAIVSIQDRGPYVQGRIVDLSPSTARKIGITPRKGVARVVVTPISVPLPDGTVKPGEATRERPRTELASIDQGG